MQEVLAEPFAVQGQATNVMSSIGVALYPRGGKAVSALTERADLAMYRAKELGRNTVQSYTTELGTQPTLFSVRPAPSALPA